MSVRHLVLVLAATAVAGGCGKKSEIQPAAPKTASRQITMPVVPTIAPKSEEPPSAIRKIMLELSQGDESVSTDIKRALGANPMDWASLQERVGEYARLTSELANHEPPRGTPESWSKFTADYAALASQLVTAAAAQNQDGVRDAQRKIELSCIACHREHHSTQFPGAKPPEKPATPDGGATPVGSQAPGGSAGPSEAGTPPVASEKK